MTKYNKLDQSGVFQLLWGGALLLMGIAFLFRIPEVVSGFTEQDHFFGGWYIKVPLYLVSFMLIGGGGRKIYKLLHNPDNKPESNLDSKNSSPDADSGSD